MRTTPSLAQVLQPILTSPTRGVVGIVDDLLGASLRHELELGWGPARCRVRSVGGTWEDLPLVPPPRPSVFRAILARIAALCNQRTPGSVSPYGGRGELAAADNPPRLLTVTFTNTPAEQRLS